MPQAKPLSDHFAQTSLSSRRRSARKRVPAHAIWLCPPKTEPLRSGHVTQYAINADKGTLTLVVKCEFGAGGGRPRLGRAAGAGRCRTAARRLPAEGRQAKS